MPKILTDYYETSEEGKILGLTVPIYKEEDWTSFDVVKKLRNASGFKKVGHAGTLDPFATGVLVLGFGRHTKTLDTFKMLKKEYDVKIHLGIETDTYDRTGSIVNEMTVPPFEESMIDEHLRSFIGKIKQLPPMYSARKVKGKALYKYARKGEEVERKLADIEIFDISIMNYSHPFLDLRISCGPGTYIRSIAHELGQKLACGAHAKELCRNAIGHFTLKEALKIEEFIEAWKLLAA